MYQRQQEAYVSSFCLRPWLDKDPNRQSHEHACFREVGHEGRLHQCWCHKVFIDEAGSTSAVHGPRPGEPLQCEGAEPGRPAIRGSIPRPAIEEVMSIDPDRLAP